jgi:acyl-CoA thioesterase
MSRTRFPFVEHIGLEIVEHRPGFSRCTLLVAPHHFNSSGTVHGAVLFTLADTGMGAALYPSLDAGQACATVEIKINYFQPVSGGVISCTSDIVHRGRSIANLESCILVDGKLVAKANGSFAVFPRKLDKASVVETSSP